MYEERVINSVFEDNREGHFRLVKQHEKIQKMVRTHAVYSGITESSCNQMVEMVEGVTDGSITGDISEIQITRSFKCHINELDLDSVSERNMLKIFEHRTVISLFVFYSSLWYQSERWIGVGQDWRQGNQFIQMKD